MRHNKQYQAIVEYTAEDNRQCREILQALCEGFVLANMEILSTSKGLREAPDYRYEEPRMGKRGQHVALAPVIAQRGYATCVEWACVRCAAERLDGRACGVRLIDTVDANGDVVPYAYHAVLEYADGSIEDVTADLTGYPKVAGGGWWAHHGHCCESCALDRPCAGDCGCGGTHNERGMTGVAC